MAFLHTFSIVALVALVLPKPINAFTTSPPSSPIGCSGFVQCRARGSAKITATEIPGGSSKDHRYHDHEIFSSSSSTALQMNLADRFFRVAKGNINSVLNSLEAPEKILDQSVVDMQNDLVKIRQSYAEIVTSQNQYAKKKDEADSLAHDWYARAQLALKRQNDGLAKEALARRQQLLDQAQNLQMQVEAQQAAADKLYRGMIAVERKIKEAKQKKNEYIARAKAAESTTKINDMLSGMTGKTSMDAFKRMESKVEALETRAQASEEMASMAYLPEGSTSVSEIEKEFLLLESSEAVEDEFQKLKTNLLLSGKSTGRSSKVGGSQTKENRIFDPSVEWEFERLKADSD